MAKRKINKFQQSVLNNRLRLITVEPAVDAMVAERVRRIYAQWESELIAIIGSRRRLTRTEVAEAERKLRALRGRFNVITKSQLAAIQREIGVITHSTHTREVYRHAQLIEGQLERFGAEVGVSHRGINRRAIDAAYRQSFPRGTLSQFGGIPKAVATQLRKDIADAIADGWTVDRLAQKWASMSGATGVARARTATLARTMVMQASSNAQLFTYTAYSDVVRGVQWEATFDTRTCSICASRHGKQYSRDDAPAQPAHYGCRCTWLPVFLDERLNSVMDSRKAYKTPDNLGVVFRQESREFDRWLRSKPADVQRDFFPSQIKYRAWRDGQLKIDQMLGPQEQWARDEAILLRVDPDWAKRLTAGISRRN